MMSDHSIELARLIAYVNGTQLMSEGELALLLNMDRVSIRRCADEGLESLETRPPCGEWGKAVMHRMKNA